MTAPLSAEELAAFERAVYLGGVRAPLAPPERVVAPDEVRPEVAALAFVAQQRRLTAGLAPRARALRAFPPAAEDSRPFLPEPLRPLFRQVILRAQRHRQTGPLIALRWLFEQRGLRPHPFDLALVREAKPLAPLVVPRVAPTWLDGPPEARARHLRMLRADDPSAARAALESVFSGEKPEVRAQLLRALEVGLGPADAPLLERAARDRSPKVKAEARRLRLRLPESEAAEAALELIGQVFELRAPSPGGRRRLGVREGQRERAEEAAAALRHLDPIRVAARLGGAPPDLARFERTTEALFGGLLLAAVEHRALDVFRTLATHHDFDLAAAIHAEVFIALSRGTDRAPFLDALMEGGLPEAFARDLILAEAWIQHLEAPLPLEGSRRLRASPTYQRWLKELADEKKAEGARLHLAAVAPLVAPRDAAAAAAELRAHGAFAAPVLALLFDFLDRATQPGEEA